MSSIDNFWHHESVEHAGVGLGSNCNTRTEFKKASNSGKKTSMSRSKTCEQKKPSIHLKLSKDEKSKLMMPGKVGWKRKCVVWYHGATLSHAGGFVDEKLKVHVYYYPPCGRNVKEDCRGRKKASVRFSNKVSL